MGKSYIKLKSITHAIKAKDILDANGFKTQIVRNTKNSNTESCGYSVVIDGDIIRAEDILKRNYIRTSGHGEIRDNL